jgi:hypothetical protein
MVAFEDKIKRKIAFLNNKKVLCLELEDVDSILIWKLAINHALIEIRELHIIVLDMEAIFGSVAHRLLDHNLQSMDFPKNIRKLLIDSYKNSNGDIINNGH